MYHFFIKSNFWIGFLLVGMISHVCGQNLVWKGRVDTLRIRDTVRGYHHQLWIYTPHRYAESQKKYPVMYLFDGQNLFENGHGYGGEWHIDETLDSIKAKVIVVGIAHGGNQRIAELTPWPHPKYGGGQGKIFLNSIVEVIKPFIDRHFRTKSEAKNTAIGGSSLGGLMAYYAAIAYPEVFGKAAVLSPAFWINRQDLTAFMDGQSHNECRVFFGCGDNEGDPDMLTDLRRFEKALHQLRCSCLHADKEVIYPGGQHNEALWSKAFRDAYLWLF